jgi:hypothetical protein
MGKKRYDQAAARDRGELVPSDVATRSYSTGLFLTAVGDKGIVERTSKGHHYWVTPTIVTVLGLSESEPVVAATLTAEHRAARAGKELRPTREVIASLLAVYTHYYANGVHNPNLMAERVLCAVIPVIDHATELDEPRL